jgi:O-antigen ligase
MTVRVRPLIVPAFVLLCLLIGGSSQGIVANALLQLLAIAMLAWAALDRSATRLPAAARPLAVIAAGMVLIALVQMVPLPPSVWTAFPGRAAVVEGMRLLGLEPQLLPISLSWHRTAATVLALLPPFAVLFGLLRFRETTERALFVAVLIGAVCGILLGLLQVAGGGDSWYLFRYNSFGEATGFFANANHLATLLLISFPFLAAIAADAWERTANVKWRALIVATSLALAGMLAVGVVISESLAMLLLAPPVAIASARIVYRGALPLGRPMLLVALVAVIGLGIVGARMSDRLVPENNSSFATRSVIWKTSMSALGDHWLAGSGIGTFPAIYPRYETDEAVDGSYINHAHNDVLELAVETGVPGALLIVAFLLWWGRRTVAVWTIGARDRYAIAATIASAVILLHSLVDFPLRTAAISVVLALSLAIMVRPRVGRRSEARADLRPTRAIEI